MTLFRQHALRRICAAAVAAALMLQPLAVYAASPIVPSLSEFPIHGLNPVRPNLMFTLDDSGSMAFEFVPDYVQYYTSLAGTGNHYFCLNQKSAAGGRICGWDRNTWGGGGSEVAKISDPPVRSSDFNRLYYNPIVDYIEGVTELRNPLPFQTGVDWKNVFDDGFETYPLLPTTKFDLTAKYPDTIWCWKSVPSALEKTAADTTGAVCRRNGYGYTTAPVVTAGYNYPNRTDGQYCKNTAGTFDCPFPVLGGPYYYTISKVQFCKNQDGSASPSLNGGFGLPPCSPQPPEDLTLRSRWDYTKYPYVRYGTDAGNAFQPSAFTRVDIRPVFLVNGVATGALSPTGRTYTQEMDNFAKFYAFYRTRLTAMKTAAGLAFTVLDNTNARVGYHTIHNRAFLNVKVFDAAQKTAWFTKLYNADANGGTPLPEAMWRIGQLFSNPNPGAWTNVPPTGLAGAADPLDPASGQCQDNFHLLATDGYWNVMTAAAHAAGDQDNKVPALPLLEPPLVGTVTIQSTFDATAAGKFTTGSNFPKGYWEGSTAVSNNLADMAMKYWINDIRKDFKNKVGGDFPWQKLTFYGLSLGAEGTIRFTGKGDSTDLADIIGGGSNWPLSPKLPVRAFGATVDDAGAEAIDDLWHAAVNGRGSYANAKDPQTLARAIVTILNGVVNQRGTGTGIATAGAQLSLCEAGAACGYRTSYNDTDPKDWSGDVRKVKLDPSTGVLQAGAPVWSAKGVMDQQAKTDPGWWNTQRKIVTMSATTGTPFLLGNLTPGVGGQQESLIKGWAGITPKPTPGDVLNFLRGDRSHEGLEPGTLRQRSHILGDFVYSAAVPVGAPSLPYFDATNPGYTDFKTKPPPVGQANRTPMVYVGGNDGMVHAFIDPINLADTNGGKEAWAYIPKALYTSGDPNVTPFTANPDFQLGSLAYPVGGIPLFKHRFMVNATPRVWDYDSFNVGVSNDPAPPASTSLTWRTILVGGLGAGGRAVYALDVTDPVKLTDSEATAATKVLWEFNTVNPGLKGDPNLGFIYDPPTLVKTRAAGWVVLVPSGYNNKDGQGFLYVLNPNTGERIAKIALPGSPGTEAAPLGLSTVRAFVSSRKDPYVLQAYSGDLKGNVWRFDLSSPNIANWKADLFATLKDASGTVQPITTGIRIEIDQNNNNRYIFVGTGKLLDQADLTNETVNSSMYVIRDGNVTTPDTIGMPYKRADLLPVNGTVVAGHGGVLGRGWYLDAADIPHPAPTPTTRAKQQKVVTDVYADLGVVTFAFSWPANDPCAPPLSATLYARNFTTGESVLEALGTTTIIPNAEIVEGIAGLQLVQGVDTGSGVMPVSVLITDMGGNVFSYGVVPPGGPSSQHRISWRVLNN